MSAIIVFKSTHDAIKAKRTLDKARIDYEILPTPKEISADCGISLRVAAPLLDRALVLLRAAEVRYRDDLL